jgi:hypothetical protein
MHPLCFSGASQSNDANDPAGRRNGAGMADRGEPARFQQAHSTGDGATRHPAGSRPGPSAAAFVWPMRAPMSICHLPERRLSEGSPR